MGLQMVRALALTRQPNNTPFTVRTFLGALFKFGHDTSPIIWWASELWEVGYLDSRILGTGVRFIAYLLELFADILPHNRQSGSCHTG